MNAGTSQRISLTLLSTLLMIRLGRVYRGLMVEVQATNAKLNQRKKRMLGFLTGRSDPEIDHALEQAQGNVKLAVLVLRGCDVGRAETFLQDEWPPQRGDCPCRRAGEPELTAGALVGIVGPTWAT
jgi:N-acetylmuramic acid 6-phosphate etherase